MNTNKRKIEVFSAGCPACAETVKLVQQIACSSCEVEVLDMNKPEVATKARQYGVKTAIIAPPPTMIRPMRVAIPRSGIATGSCIAMPSSG